MLFIISGIIFAAFDIFILDLLLKAALNGDMIKTLIFFMLKFLSYGAAFAIVYFFFLSSIKLLVIGFSIGLFTAMPIILLRYKKNSKKLKKSDKGDDSQ